MTDTLQTNPAPQTALHPNDVSRSVGDQADIADDWGHYPTRGFSRSSLPTSVGHVSFHEAGEGTPIVFLHGIGGGASSWTWTSVAPGFVGSHRVVVPDLIGWGLSDHPARPILFDDYVTVIEALLDRLGQKAVVVAQSLGAGFALAVAERRPDLVERLILTNPTGLRDFGRNDFPAFIRIGFALLTRTPGVRLAFYKALFHRRSFMENWYRTQGYSDPNAVPADVIDGALYSATRPNAAFSALPFLTGDVHFDIVPLLQRANVPVTILIGGDPDFVGVRNARRLADVRSDILVTTIPNSKACLELEQPEAVADAIATALASSSRQTHAPAFRRQPTTTP